MNEKVLRERRDTALAAADAIVLLAEQEERGLTAQEAADVTAHLEEAERVKEELEGAERAKAARVALDAAKRATGAPEAMRAGPEGETPEAPATTTVRVHEPAGRAYEKGDALGAIVSARMRFGAWEQGKAVNWARITYGESSPQCRAMQQSQFTSGGAFIPENFVGGEFIELLRAQAQVRRAGARSITLTNGSATIPKITGGATGGWIGEGENITPSELSTGQIKLVEKKYGVLVPISNDLRRNSSLETERVVRDDMVRVTANDEDTAFLRGTGLLGQPKGIYNWIPAAGKSNSGGITLADTRTDIRVAKNRLNNNNVPMVRRAWFMHSRVAEYLGWEMVDGNGNFAYPQMQADDGAILGGARVYRDNNISITLGAGAATEIYYVEMSECFIGDSLELEIEMIENAVYADAAGTIRSGVSRDESVIRLIRKTDFGMRHDVAAHVREAVAY
jgi:HK97 family phage major capsid protein